MTKQVIVVNKGLNMSKGKMAAQVAHAAMAFMTNRFIDEDCRYKHPVYDQYSNIRTGYVLTIPIDNDVNDWMMNSFAKVILEVKSENGLEKVVEKAKEAGMIEGVDFFCIRDNCRTELEPDETGTRFTCIGFKPMENSKIDAVTKRLQLFKE